MRAYATDFWAVPPHASLFTGLYPVQTGAITETVHLPASNTIITAKPGRNGFTHRRRCLKVGLSWSQRPWKAWNYSDHASRIIKEGNRKKFKALGKAGNVVRNPGQRWWSRKKSKNTIFRHSGEGRNPVFSNSYIFPGLRSLARTPIRGAPEWRLVTNPSKITKVQNW